MSMWLSDDDVAGHWDRNAEAWADMRRHRRDEYRELVLNPAFTRFIGNIRGKTVLDAGCGEGDSSRILARQGAQVVGVDISSQMLAYAREEEARERQGIEYRKTSFSDLSMFDDGTFDAVVSVMALMDTSRYDLAVREFMRVLRPEGALAFSVRHPCFAATPGARVVRLRKDERPGLFVGDYFRQNSWVERKPCGTVQGPDKGEFFVAPRFPYTLSTYLNTLLEAGFALTRIEEPRPAEEDCQQRGWLEFWRHHAALYLFVRAEKPADG